MPKPWTVTLSVIFLVLSGCGGDPKPATGPSARPTAIAGLDSSAMHVVRIAFCDLVPKPAVRRALGAAPKRARSWGNGDRLADAAGQVGHEFGCSWAAAGGRAARAWVFARPVNPAYAGSLVRRTLQERGCGGARAANFGTPAVIQTCLGDGSARRIRRAGLFGDTWLSCEVSSPGSKHVLRKRVDAWCLEVVNALNVGRR